MQNHISVKSIDRTHLVSEYFPKVINTTGKLHQHNQVTSWYLKYILFFLLFVCYSAEMPLNTT